MSLSFGDKDTTTTQNQSSTTNPWAPAIPNLTALLQQLGQIPTGVTPAQTGAFSTLEGNAANGNPFAGQIGSAVTGLLNAPNEGGAVGAANNTINQNLGGMASGANLDPTKSPGIQGLLDTVRSDISNQVNRQFAGAGRDLSGANTQALSRGIAQGEAPILLNQYNQNVANQLAANGQIASTGAATTAGQAGADTTQANIRGAGITGSDAALAAQNYAPTQILNLEQQQTQLPFQNLGLLASILFPAAGLGNQQQATGTSDSNTSGFSLGANILSDERAKTDKKEIGSMADGTPMYSYRYKGDPVTRVGPMAQEVEQRAPGAVQTDPKSGYKTVNMDKATQRAAEIMRNRKRRAA